MGELPLSDLINAAWWSMGLDAAYLSCRFILPGRFSRNKLIRIGRQPFFVFGKRCVRSLRLNEIFDLR